MRAKLRNLIRMVGLSSSSKDDGAIVRADGVSPSTPFSQAARQSLAGCEMRLPLFYVTECSAKELIVTHKIEATPSSVSRSKGNDRSIPAEGASSVSWRSRP